MKNKTYLKLWVFDCDLQDALLILISLNQHPNIIFHSKFLYANLSGGKGGT